MKTLFGSWFVEQKWISHPQAGEVDYFDVGQVVRVGGETLYHTSSDRSFKSFAEAKAWVLRQPGASEDN